MKTMILILLIGIGGAFAADLPAAPAAKPATAETKKAPPTITDAQKKDAWRKTAELNAATATKWKAAYDSAVAAAREKDVEVKLNSMLGGFCSDGFQLDEEKDGKDAGDPKCAEKLKPHAQPPTVPDLPATAKTPATATAPATATPPAAH